MGAGQEEVKRGSGGGDPSVPESAVASPYDPPGPTASVNPNFLNTEDQQFQELLPWKAPTDVHMLSVQPGQVGTVWLRGSLLIRGSGRCLPLRWWEDLKITNKESDTVPQHMIKAQEVSYY